MALHLVNPFEHRERIDAGVKWLVAHQNADGGWGDTIKSFSNISTTMLCRAALAPDRSREGTPRDVEKVEDFLTAAGRHDRPKQRAEAIRQRYGKDRTFSVPILMSCALAGLVPWNEVPRLPFEAGVPAAKLVSLRADAGRQLRAAGAHRHRPVRAPPPRTVEPDCATSCAG